MQYGPITEQVLNDSIDKMFTFLEGETVSDAEKAISYAMITDSVNMASTFDSRSHADLLY